jgi:hypothetical protein
MLALVRTSSPATALFFGSHIQAPAACGMGSERLCVYGGTGDEATYNAQPTPSHHTTPQKENVDSCEIRTHAGFPNNLAGYRLNHSAKLSTRSSQHPHPYWPNELLLATPQTTATHKCVRTGTKPYNDNKVNRHSPVSTATFIHRRYTREARMDGMAAGSGEGVGEV